MSTTTTQPATLYQLRQRVQSEINAMVDGAHRCYRLAVNAPRNTEAKIRAKARQRVHAWLAHRLGIRELQVNTLDNSDCQMSLYLLRRVDFSVIRLWAKGAGL